MATYLVLGFVAYWPVLPGISHRLFGQTSDYVLSEWFIGWIPHAIAHGLDPFFTNSMFVPTGVNLAQNTASPLLGLIGAPLTEALSPLVTTNVLMVVAMPLSATAAFVVLRKWKVWLPGAALGGLVYGFSPYMVGQGTDHIVFTFARIPPFIALTIVSILQRKGSPWRLGIELALLVAAQYLICQEVIVDTVIVSVAALVCVIVYHHTSTAQATLAEASASTPWTALNSGHIGPIPPGRTGHCTSVGGLYLGEEVTKPPMRR